MRELLSNIAIEVVVACRAEDSMANFSAADRKDLGLLQVEIRSPPSKTRTVALEVDGVRSLE